MFTGHFGIGFGAKKFTPKLSLIIFSCVVSHWFLDLIMHRPDLPVLPGDPTRLGLGLWNHPILSLLLEGIVFY